MAEKQIKNVLIMFYPKINKVVYVTNDKKIVSKIPLFIRHRISAFLYVQAFRTLSEFRKYRIDRTLSLPHTSEFSTPFC